MGVAGSHHSDEIHELRDRTVKDLDLKKFSGTWWVFANTKNKFESCCQRSTREFAFDESKGELKVLSRCWCKNEVSRECREKMCIPDECDKGKMHATLIENCQEYHFYVHCTDYTSFAIVGHPDHDRVWILTRDEFVHCDMIDKFMDMVSDFGYDVNCVTAPECAIKYEKSC